jgi:hypothetical protein
MAIVRICQLAELDDLATLVAELRGADAADSQGQATPRPSGGGERATGALAGSLPPRPVVKKNVEPLAVTTAAMTAAPAAPATSSAGQRSAVEEVVATAEPETMAGAGNERNELRDDRPHDEVPAPAGNSETTDAPSAESVLAQFQRAMAGGTPPRPASPQRVSRREKLTQIAEQPFVRRAMELFDVAPDKLRYSPPEGESN